MREQHLDGRRSRQGVALFVLLQNMAMHTFKSRSRWKNQGVIARTFIPKILGSCYNNTINRFNKPISKRNLSTQVCRREK